MLSEGIPFIIAGQQIYMPFLGIALTQNGIREITQMPRMSFAAQVLPIMLFIRIRRGKRLRNFQRVFCDFQEQYVLIGGISCDLAAYEIKFYNSLA